MRDDSSDLQARIVERLRFVNGHADNWRLFDDAELITAVVDALVEPFRDRAITKVAGIEARGFILGGASALRLGVASLFIFAFGERIAHPMGWLTNLGASV